jgi:hypothetical protein
MESSSIHLIWRVVLAKVHVPRYVRQAWLVLCVFPQVPDRRGDPIVSMLFSCHGSKVGAPIRQHNPILAEFVISTFSPQA